MTCTETRPVLSALLYGDLPAEEAAAVQAHLAGCPACREEYAGLERVRHLLDTARTPAISVDLARLYAEAGRLQERRARRWRRTAVAAAGLAAAVLLALALRVEVRADTGQLVIGWGAPREAPAPAPLPPPREVIREVHVADSGNVEQVRLALALVRAVADDCDARDQRLHEKLTQVENRLASLQAQTNRRWQDTEGYVAALYTALYGPRAKGGTR
jgi:anti-sigma factor RsiW